LVKYFLLSKGFIYQKGDRIQYNIQLKNYIPLPINVVRTCISNLEPLITLSKIYKLHTKNIIYNVEKCKLAKDLLISKNTLYKHLKFLKGKNLIREDNGHLIINGLRKLKTIYGQKIVKIKIYSTRKEQRASFRGIILIKNINSQKKAIKLKSDLENIEKKHFKTLSDIKYMNKAKKILSNGRKLNSKSILSNKKIGMMLFKSMTTGKRLQKDLNNMGVIKSSSNYEKVNNIKYTKMYINLIKDLSNSFYLSNKGYWYKRLPNEITVLQ